MRGFAMRSRAIGIAGVVTVTLIAPLAPTTLLASTAQAATTSTNSSRFLEIGSRGADVYALERKLKMKSADSVYTQWTAKRVRQAQKWAGIKRTGSYGPRTAAIINEFVTYERKVANNKKKAALKKQQALAAKAKAGNTKRAKIVAAAKKNSGKPYRYGSSGPSSFDCSGFTGHVVKTAIGKKLPRSSGAQRGAVQKISRSAAKPGDLVFFHGGGGVYHVGIYAGGNKLYHSSRPGTKTGLAKIFSSNVSFGKVV